jgi:sugar O-acyltransferase (sialic acid O-acetyltransferase NeuD family)
MKEVYIINAGGFGRTVASLACSDAAYGSEWIIKGMLDDRDVTTLKSDPWPIIGSPMTHRYEPGQIIVCALGDPFLREKYSRPLDEQGADFMSLTPDLHRAQGADIANGGIFERNTLIGADSQLGRFVLMHSFSVVGHDVSIGSYTTIGSFAFIGGGARIGSHVTIFPHVTVLPGVKVGQGARIGAGSVVISDVPEGVTVMGNPAKIFSFRADKS